MNRSFLVQMTCFMTFLCVDSGRFLKLLNTVSMIIVCDLLLDYFMSSFNNDKQS